MATLTASSSSNGNNPANPGIGRRLTTPAHMFSVGYTTGQEAAILAREIKNSRYGTVGLVHPGGMYHGVLAPLLEALPDVRIVELDR